MEDRANHPNRSNFRLPGEEEPDTAKKRMLDWYERSGQILEEMGHAPSPSDIYEERPTPSVERGESRRSLTPWSDVDPETGEAYPTVLSEMGDEEVEMHARRVAGEWHGGQTSALYALSSSGHLGHPNLEREIQGVGDPTDRQILWEHVSRAPQERFADPRTRSSEFQAGHSRPMFEAIGFWHGDVEGES